MISYAEENIVTDSEAEREMPVDCRKSFFYDKQLFEVKKILSIFRKTKTNGRSKRRYNLTVLIEKLLLYSTWENYDIQKSLLDIIFHFTPDERYNLDLYSFYRAGNENLYYLKMDKSCGKEDFKEYIHRYSDLYGTIYRLGFTIKELAREFNCTLDENSSEYNNECNIFTFIQNVLSKLLKYRLIFCYIRGNITLLKTLFNQWSIFKKTLHSSASNIKNIEYIVNSFEFTAFKLAANIMPEHKFKWFINKVKTEQSWYENNDDHIYSYFLGALKFYKELNGLSCLFIGYESNLKLIYLVENFGAELVNKAIKIIQPLCARTSEEDIIAYYLKRSLDLLKINCTEKYILHIATEKTKNHLKKGKLIKEIVEIFQKKHGRVPGNKIFWRILDMVHYDMEVIKYIVEKFQYKAVLEVIKSNDMVLKELDLSYKLKLVCLFWNKWKDIKEQIIKSSNKKKVKPSSEMHSFLASLDNTPFLNSGLREWLSNNAGANSDLISNICYVWDNEKFPRRGSIKQMRQWMEQNEMESEYGKCKKKWPNLGWGNFPCKLPMTKTKSAEVLNPNDKRMVMVGIITHCCQRRYGTAESCMVASLTHPRSSNLVFYHQKHKNKIIAYAWIWDFKHKGESILVLDNIELADHREVDYILPSLKEWCEASPYKNIQLGTRCSDISIKGFSTVVETEYMGKLSGYNEYTDAGHRVWLKNNGKIFV